MGNNVHSFLQLASAGQLPLAQTRDVLTIAPADGHVEDTLMQILYDHKEDPSRARPLQRLRKLLDDLREEPVGPKRLLMNNTVVRTLGQPPRVFVI